MDPDAVAHAPAELPAGLDDATILERTAAGDTEDAGDPDDPELSGAAPSIGARADTRAGDEPPIVAPRRHSLRAPSAPHAASALPSASAPPPAHRPAARSESPTSGHAHSPNGHPAPMDGHPDASNGEAAAALDLLERTATAPQLRRFIKSRAYVPMHELRRRFAMNGGEDEVTPIDLDHGRIYVGLPVHEGALLGELFRAGDIGYELSMDPIAPIVVGVYPMRPVPRS